VSSTSPTYAVLLQHLHLHYPPAGKNHVADHFVDGIKMKDTVDVFVMDGTRTVPVPGTYGNAERFEVPYVGDIAVINYQVPCTCTWFHPVCIKVGCTGSLS
jgi:hypothetical protein